MQILDHMALLGALDWTAVAAILSAWLFIGWWIEHPGAARPSVTVLMSQRRRDWMKVMVTREPRIFDSQIVNSLRQGTAFFASTCLLAIGGVLLATRLDSIGEAAVLRETSVVFAALIGWFILGEKVGPRRLILMCLVALGAVIVEMGG